ncbi:MAG: hypothetical protein AB3N64_01990 [Puniceicoccaceae bacterium]
MNFSLAVFLVVSPGEERIAEEGLHRALALVPEEYTTSVYVFDNTGKSNLIDRLSSREEIAVITVPEAPRPYTEIGKTVFWCFGNLAKRSFDLLIKLDPDTVVLSREFFEDLASLSQSEQADFIAPHAVYRARGDNMKRWMRLLVDCLPVGLSREPATHRYGKAGKLRIGMTWHARATFWGLMKLKWPYAQPTGGGYAIGKGILGLMDKNGYLVPAGKNGLEWNDDVLLPILIKMLGGKVIDIRKTRFVEGWKYMHGARYFTIEDLNDENLRAIHPLKDTEADWTIRSAIPCVTLKHHV